MEASGLRGGRSQRWNVGVDHSLTPLMSLAIYRRRTTCPFISLLLYFPHLFGGILSFSFYLDTFPIYTKFMFLPLTFILTPLYFCL
jgi:hypothetical protein